MRRHDLLVAALILAAGSYAIGRATAQDAAAPDAAPANDAAQNDATEGDADAQPPADNDADKSAPKKKDAGPPDPNGAWRWERSFQGNTAEFVVRLAWEDKKLTGKYSAFGMTSDIEEARFEKDELSFVAKREFNGNQFVVRFKGKIEGDEIRGDTTVDFGQGPQDFEWIAKRTVKPEDVLGVWKLRVESPRGVVEPQLTITREGEALKGAYESPFGQREAKSLVLKDGELSWEISGDAGGNSFKVVYHGKPRGNAIAGKSEFDFAGTTGEAQFTGKRTPPKEEAQAAAGGQSAGGAGAQDRPANSRSRPPLDSDADEAAADPAT